VNVIAAFYEEGSVLRGDKHGECRGFEIEVSLDSDAPLETIQEMIELAHQMCFTEAAITQAIEVQFTHKLNGKEIQPS
jgi:organic hydroperoxide reductase OsmC/OhrA